MVLHLPDSWSNWKLEMFGFCGEGKTGVTGEKHFQRKERTKNKTPGCSKKEAQDSGLSLKVRTGDFPPLLSYYEREPSYFHPPSCHFLVYLLHISCNLKYIKWKSLFVGFDAVWGRNNICMMFTGLVICIKF